MPVGRTLAETLRDDLGLTGTKIACGEGHCGTCTVQLDGVPVLSCITLVHTVGAREVTTIEGLRDHPLVQAFVGDLLHVSPGGAKDVNPSVDQQWGWKRDVPVTLHADKLRDDVEIPGDHELVAPGDDRHLADSEREKPVVALPVAQDVDGDEIDAALRKKLLRAKTARSARLGVEDECVVVGFHGRHAVTR